MQIFVSVRYLFLQHVVAIIMPHHVYSDFKLKKFSSLLKEQKSVSQVQAVTFTKAKNQQPGNVERCFMMSIYCLFRNHHICIHKLADIKVFIYYDGETWQWPPSS